VSYEHRRLGHDGLGDAPGTVIIDTGNTTLNYALGHVGTMPEATLRSARDEALLILGFSDKLLALKARQQFNVAGVQRVVSC